MRTDQGPLYLRDSRKLEGETRGHWQPSPGDHGEAWGLFAEASQTRCWQCSPLLARDLQGRDWCWRSCEGSPSEATAQDPYWEPLGFHHLQQRGSPFQARDWVTTHIWKVQGEERRYKGKVISARPIKRRVAIPKVSRQRDFQSNKVHARLGERSQLQKGGSLGCLWQAIMLWIQRRRRRGYKEV